jgi:hypothetical protein
MDGKGSWDGIIFLPIGEENGLFYAKLVSHQSA